MSFSFYTVDTKYCDYLRIYDDKIPYTMEKKSTRPFVGIIFAIKAFRYYAPLTSPKPKHLQMKNQVDFLKINDGKWGAINFNNMIPVNDFSLRKVELKPSLNDGRDMVAYKNLLMNQLSWCNSNRETILRQAEKLYYLIISGKAWESLSGRCCNFADDEVHCAEYCNLCICDNKWK